MERNPNDVWFLVRFYVSPRAVVTNVLYNYSLGLIEVNWSPIFRCIPFCGLDFLDSLVIFHFLFQRKFSLLSQKEKDEDHLCKGEMCHRQIVK